MQINSIFNTLFVNEVESDTESEYSSVESYKEENTVVQYIINNTAITTYNTSIERDIIAEVWQITN